MCVCGKHISLSLPLFLFRGRYFSSSSIDSTLPCPSPPETPPTRWSSPALPWSCRHAVGKKRCGANPTPGFADRGLGVRLQRRGVRAPEHHKSRNPLVSGFSGRKASTSKRFPSCSRVVSFHLSASDAFQRRREEEEGRGEEEETRVCCTHELTPVDRPAVTVTSRPSLAAKTIFVARSRLCTPQTIPPLIFLCSIVDVGPPKHAMPITAGAR